MNFRDELNEICRTPEEVAAEKSSKEYEKGEKSASLTHNYIKDEIRKRVKSGEYEIVDGRKCVKFYYDKNNLLLFDSRPKKSEYRINKSFLIEWEITELKYIMKYMIWITIMVL